MKNKLKKKYVVLEDVNNKMRFITANKPMPLKFLKNCIPIAFTNYHSYAKKVCKKGKRFDFEEMKRNMQQLRIYAQ